MKKIQLIILCLCIAWSSLAQNAYNIIPLPKSLKPDAVSRNLVGEVVSRFERKGFKLLKFHPF